MTERTERLRQAAAARHDATLARATAAIHALGRTAGPIPFCGVARAAGVSRSWLYRQPDLRGQIEQLRQSPPPRPPRVPPVPRASDESNRQKLRIYREELTRLQTENRDLREQLARRLGAERAAAVVDMH